MSFVEKSDKILEHAILLEPQVSGWAEFSNALFDQRSGLVQSMFSDPMELNAFWDSPQCAAINAILLRLMKQHGIVEGSLTRD